MALETSEVGKSEKCEGKNYSFKQRFMIRFLTYLLALALITITIVVSVEYLYPLTLSKDRDVSSSKHQQKNDLSDRAKDSVDLENEMTRKIPPAVNFLLQPESLCSTSEPPNLLILLLSSTERLEHRNTVRSTWGSLAKEFENVEVRFVLGSANASQEEHLLEEQQSHEDLIQADVLDSNMMAKSIAMLQWVAQWCPEAKHFLKSDDSTFVNLGRVVDLLRTEPFNSWDKFIGGFVRTPNEYPQLEASSNGEGSSAPPHIASSAYVTQGRTAAELLQASTEAQPLFSSDDVFLTGQCGEKIGATLIHEPLFRTEPPDSSLSYSDFASVPYVNPQDMEDLWRQIQALLSSEMDAFVPFF